MKRPGPAKKPTNLKVIQGTFRKDRAPTNEAQPEIEIPPVPAELSDAAKVEWGRVSQELAQLGLLSRIDRAVLAMYCEAWSDYLDALKMCASKDGRDRKVIKTAAGNVIESPYFSIKKRCAEMVYKFACEFGMGAAARSSINVKPKQDEDEFDSFVQKRNKKA